MIAQLQGALLTVMVARTRVLARHRGAYEPATLPTIAAR